MFAGCAVVAGLPALLLLAAAPASRAQQAPTPTDMPASQAAGIIQRNHQRGGLAAALRAARYYARWLMRRPWCTMAGGTCCIIRSFWRP
ncbi:MAG: hypothetical protein WKG07_49210 [Hymenobacter sp.]